MVGLRARWRSKVAPQSLQSSVGAMGLLRLFGLKVHSPYDTAEQNDAPRELVEKIRDADTQRFNSPDEVLQAVQGR